MRNLTEQEQAILKARTEGLDRFVQESFPAIAELFESLGFPEPKRAVLEPEKFVQPLSEILRDVEIPQELTEDKLFIAARLSYFIGDLMRERYSGAWFVQDSPNDRFFLHYVVGEFARSRSVTARFSPFDVVSTYLGQPPGRDLVALVAEVAQEIETV